MKLITKVFNYTLILIPFILFFLFFFLYTIDSPISDDYVLLSFMNDYISSNSFLDKIKLFFAQHNEHRIVYDRIWTLLTYKINGEINFKFLSFIGNLSLLGIAYVFYKKMLLIDRNILLFFPISILIFNLTSWENIIYPMAALSNFTVYLFILLSLYFITLDTKESKRNLYFSIVFFVLAIFTQGGGLFLYPISLLILLFKKEYKNIFIYFAIASSFVLIYFYDYHDYGQSKSMVDSVLEYKFLVIQYSCAFIANAFNYYRIFTSNAEESLVATSMLGAVFLTIFVYITIKKYYNKNLFIYSVLLLIIASSMVTGVSRLFLGIETAGTSRYRINGIIFAVALYFWFIESYRLNRKIHVLSIISLSLIYLYYFNFKQYEYLQINQKRTSIGALAYNSGDYKHLVGDKNFLETNLKDLKKAKENNIYTFPKNEDFLNTYPISRIVKVKSNQNLITSSNNNLPMTYSVETLLKLDGDYFIDGWAFIEWLDASNQEIYVGIKNETETQPKYFSTIRTPRFDLNPYFKKNNLEKGGFNARIKFSEIKDGENQIFLLVLNEGKFTIKETNKFIKK